MEKAFEDRILGIWADRFGTNADYLRRPCTIVTDENDWDEAGKFVLYELGKASVLRIGKNTLARLGAIDLNSRAVQPDDIPPPAAAQPPLLDYFLGPDDFSEHPPPSGVAARMLDTAADHDDLMALFGACSDSDLDEADIYVDALDPVNFGIYHGDMLAAYASYRDFDHSGLMDIGVLIHPEHRGKGLGKAVVSAICKHGIAAGDIMMYHVFCDHTHSKRIPEALGFSLLLKVHSMALG